MDLLTRTQNPGRNTRLFWAFLHFYWIRIAITIADFKRNLLSKYYKFNLGTEIDQKEILWIFLLLFTNGDGVKMDRNLTKQDWK